jgi:neutral ceramidase
LVVFSLVLAGLIAAPTTYRLGVVEITPPEPLPLGGYTARAGKLCDLPGDRIEARALILEKSNSRIAVTVRIAIVSADLLTIPESLVEEVRERIPKDTQLFLVATHTHCAPDSQMLNRRMDFTIPGIAKFNEKWLSWYADRIALAVRLARSGKAKVLSDAQLAFGRRALNRGRRPFADADTLATRFLNGNGSPLVTHYAAHAVLFGPQRNSPSPDYPGKIRGQGLFLPGAIGDMSPASHGPTPDAQIENFAQNFEEGFWQRERLPVDPLAMIYVPLSGFQVWPNKEFARLNKIPEPLAQSIVNRFAPTDGYLSVMRLGKLAIVGVPGEPTAELGKKIRSIGLGLGFRAVLTVSHCNGWMGYILTPEDYDRGGYESSLAFHGRTFGDLIIAHAKKGLAALRNYGQTGQIIFDEAPRRAAPLSRL